MDEDILRKVRALLALASSSNPNEAAAALQKAQELMSRYGLRELDIKLSEVRQKRASGGRNVARPPAWMFYLSGIVEKAFGVSSIWSRAYRGSGYIFVGVGPAADVAAYCFEVLRRRCERDRATYYKRLRGKRQNRIRRADAFAEGWCLAVYGKVHDFAKDCPTIVGTYIAERFSIETYRPKSARDRAEDHHIQAGQTAGSSVDLSHGVGTDSPQTHLGNG